MSLERLLITCFVLALLSPLPAVAGADKSSVLFIAVDDLNDLYPTLVDLCQVSGPGTLCGESLVPLLRSPANSTDRAVVTLFDRDNVSLRTEQWRFIRYADGAEELYDLIQDPQEWHNLAVSADHAKIRTLLRDRLNRLYRVKQ